MEWAVASGRDHHRSLNRKIKVRLMHETRILHAEAHGTPIPLRIIKDVRALDRIDNVLGIRAKIRSAINNAVINDLDPALYTQIMIAP